MRSRSRIVAEACASGRTRLRELVASAPFSFRQTGEGLYLVNSAQALVGDDTLELEIEVGAGAELVVRSAAASVAYASSTASLRVRAYVADGAALTWRPEPLITTSRCHVRVDAAIVLEAEAALEWTEECVLGRTGEEPGSAELSLRIDDDGRPALRHALCIGADAPGWDGPAVLGGHRAVGLRALVAPTSRATSCAAEAGEGWAVLPLERRGALVVGAGADLIALRAAMAGRARAWHREGA